MFTGKEQLVTAAASFDGGAAAETTDDVPAAATRRQSGMVKMARDKRGKKSNVECTRYALGYLPIRLFVRHKLSMKITLQIFFLVNVYFTVWHGYAHLLLWPHYPCDAAMLIHSLTRWSCTFPAHPHVTFLIVCIKFFSCLVWWLGSLSLD